MRIDFFHVDLLPKSSIRGISDVYSNNGVENDFNSDKQSNKIKKDKLNKDTHNNINDYNDILKEIKKDSSNKNEYIDYDDDFVSDDDLNKLKKSLEENSCNISSKILLISIIKYTERI